MSPLRLAAVALLASAVSAQAVPEQSTTHWLGIDSGIVRNTSASPATIGVPQVVWSTVVTVPGAAWLRLHYGGILLSGSPEPGRDGSYLRLTSLLDGAVQTQHLVHVGQWQETSAYFNGSSVMVELLAHGNTGDNRLVVREATAGPLSPLGTDSICGPTDDRQLSSDTRVARNQPTGCTSWLIDDCNHCFLTAGHCAGSGLQVVQFNVPLSTSSGSIQHPPPQDQYAVDTASLQSNGGQGVGNDWAYFGVFDNSTTGMTPYQANGGLTFDLQASPPPVSGQNIRITGNGSTSSPVSPTWYLVQKTHSGPFASFGGTTVRYTTDTTGGNSGSPVIVDGTNQAIGIHTHGGCSSTGGSNAGTGSNHPGLNAALSNPQGVCACPGIEFSFPNGLPSSVAPDGSATIRFVLGGPVQALTASARFHVAVDGGPLQVLVPTTVNATTFDATMPATTCGSVLTFYFSAQDAALTTYTSPEGAPTTMHQAPSADALTVLRNYDFNTTPPAWTVVNTALATGAWVRGTPIDSRGPQQDFDGSGQCWVTGNTNLQDVDGGPTTLYTETIDLSAAYDPTVSYAVWFTNDDNDDFLVVDVSNDGGGNWVNVETLGPLVGWHQLSLRVRDVFPSPGQFRMRFATADQPNNSVTEAALDAFRIDDITCTSATWNTFGAGCADGSTAPSLQLVSLPTLGGTFEVRVDNLGTAPPVMVVGLSQVSIPLPQPSFAAGCTLLVQTDVVEVLTPIAGSAAYSLSVPNDPTLAGLLIYQQAVAFGSLWTVSQGGVGEIQ